MSAQPSPDGSPVGAGTEGQGATAGEVLAMRMIQAAESAATAAQAATQAVATLTANAVGSQSTNSGKPEWYKVLPKPSTFELKDREAELSGFRDWWWQVEQYIVAAMGRTCCTFAVTWMKRCLWSSRIQRKRDAVGSCMDSWLRC